MKKALLLAVFLLLSIHTFSQVFTAGPMLHCYLTKGRPKVTIGLEVGIYGFGLKNGMVPSIDLGIEGGNDVSYIYSEIQLTRSAPQHNYVFEGVSLGIFKKKEKDIPAVLGLQSTVWAIQLIGGDIRLRLTKFSLDGGIGVFGKLPLLLGGRYIGA